MSRGELQGFYDYELEEWILKGVRMVDVGNVRIHGELEEPNLNRITEMYRRVLRGDTLPISLGGDHSITFAILRAYQSAARKIHVIHFDSHLDFKDMHSYTHGTPMRKIIELPWISGLTSVGIRGLRDTEQLEAGRARGVQVLSAWKVLQMGLTNAMASIPEAEGVR